MNRARNRLAQLLELTAGLAERMDVQGIASFVLGVGLGVIRDTVAHAFTAPLADDMAILVPYRSPR